MKETAPTLIQSAPEGAPSLLEKVWRALAHPVLWAILTTLVAGVLAAHLGLPQLPTALANDPLAAATWLDSAASAMPGGRVFRALGLFDLAHNLALRALLPLYAAVLLLHLAGGALRAWLVRELDSPERWLPGLHAWDAVVDSPASDATWQEECAAICAGPRTAFEAGEVISLGMCDCHHRAQWLGLAWELGLLTALAALLLNLYSGWQIDPIVLDPGQSASLTPYAARDVSLNEDASQLALCCPLVATPVSRGSVRSDGVSIRVIASGRAARVVLLADGRPLQLQAIEESARVARQLVVHFPESRSERVIAAPEANLAFRLVALDDGGVRVQALDADNQILFSQDVRDPAALPIDETLILQVAPTSYVTLRAQGRPWTWLLPLAGLLMLAGLMARWRRPYWRVGVRVNDAGMALRWQGAARTRSLFQRLLDDLTSTH
ncbi:MAG TPA: hypothetical protein G4O05_04395 [Caldilineae bacterium]|nr:hypothetical protein [Caldilineae bacterium]